MEKRVAKPYGSEYPQNPETVGEHIRKKRIESRLFQREVAKLIGVTVESITNWENNHSEIEVKYLPKIIEFLGYIPFEFDLSTLGGRIKHYRLLHGLTPGAFGKLVGVHETTVAAWEKGTSRPKKPKEFLLEALLRQDASTKLIGIEN